MSNRIKVPWLLRLHWAWLFAAFLAEFLLRALWKVHFGWRPIAVSLPAWGLIQAGWLISVYPVSKALYWDLADVPFHVSQHYIRGRYSWHIFALSQLFRI